MLKKLLLLAAVIFMTVNLSYSNSSFSTSSDGEWITLSGEVTRATANYFMLDKGNKSIIVEMDDSDWYKEGYNILKGDQVIVYGKVDQDFLEKRKVEAGSVFVKSMNSFYYASSDDEEPAPYVSSFFWGNNNIPEDVVIELTGYIQDISGKSFILNTGVREIKVDTSHLVSNPLNNIGYFKISDGDEVRVSGNIEDNWFTKDELTAYGMIILKK